MNDKSSLYKNIFYNVVSQIVTLIVPLITAPYISRIFNTDLIGTYSYALANSTYFVLLENFGFTLYGQLKVAAIREDKEKLTQVFYEIFALRLLAMVISIVGYYCLIIRVHTGLSRSLAIVLLFNIIANGLDVTWFLNGLELFKITALRSVLIRIVNLLLIFIVVQSRDHLILYALIMQGTTFVFSLAMVPTAVKRVHRRCVSSINMMQHIKPACLYFIPGLVTTIFSSADKTMLGVMTNTYEVGVYEQANKISQICMSSISAIGNVLLPRAVYIHNNKDSHNGKDLLLSFLNILFLVSFPVVFGISCVADKFVAVFYGAGYEKSSILLIILSLNVFFSSIGNLLSQQCLIARNRQAEYNWAIVSSASINVILNFILIKSYSSVGAAIASVISVFTIFLFVSIRCHDMVALMDIVKGSRKYILSTLVMSSIVKVTLLIPMGNVWSLIISIVAGGVAYCLMLILLKEPLFTTLIKSFFKR